MGFNLKFLLPETPRIYKGERALVYICMVFTGSIFSPSKESYFDSVHIIFFFSYSSFLIYFYYPETPRIYKRERALVYICMVFPGSIFFCHEIFTTRKHHAYIREREPWSIYVWCFRVVFFSVMKFLLPGNTTHI